MSGKTVKIILVALTLTAFVVYLILGRVNFGALSNIGGEYGFVEVELTEPVEYASPPSFYPSESPRGVYAATKDGMKFISESGKTTPLAMYSDGMQNPVIRGAGSYAAVGEQGGGSLYILGDGAFIREIALLGPLVSFSVSERGETCAITQNGDGYEMAVYSKGGDRFAKGNFSQKNVFPVGSALSADGRFLAIVFHDASGVEAASCVNIYALNNNESADLPDNLLGVIADIPGETVFAARFADKNKILLVSDKSIICADVDPKVARAWRAPSRNRLLSVYIAKDSFAVLYGAPLANENAEIPGTIKVFSIADMEERAVIEPSASWQPASLSGGGKSAFLAVGNSSLRAYSLKDGANLWEYAPPLKVSSSALVSSDTLLVAYEKRAELLKREKQKVNDETESNAD